MSKIEIYKAAKAVAEDARNFADGVSSDQPHDSHRYIDKLGIDFTITRTWAGTYGNSSSYTWADRTTKEIKKQIDIDLRDIIMRAAERLEAEAEERRVDAIDEAREVLAEINGANAEGKS